MKQNKRIYTDRHTFRNGIAKLTENIMKSMIPDENGNIDPFIKIPEEFDPRYPLVMTSINTVVNNADIFGLYMQDIHDEAIAFENEEGVLIGAIKDETTTRNEMMQMLHCNNKFISSILCMELYKELMDAIYFVAFELVNSITELTGASNVKQTIFQKLTDINGEVGIDTFMRRLIIDNVNTTKNILMNDYTLFTYVYYMRGALCASFSDHWYNIVRDYSYALAMGNNIEESQKLISAIEVTTTQYLYVLDNVFNVILSAFQPKVQFCYSHSFEFEKELLEKGYLGDKNEDE